MIFFKSISLLLALFFTTSVVSAQNAELFILNKENIPASVFNSLGDESHVFALIEGSKKQKEMRTPSVFERSVSDVFLETTPLKTTVNGDFRTEEILEIMMQYEEIIGPDKANMSDIKIKGFVVLPQASIEGLIDPETLYPSGGGGVIPILPKPTFPPKSVPTAAPPFPSGAGGCWPPFCSLHASAGQVEYIAPLFVGRPQIKTYIQLKSRLENTNAVTIWSAK